MEVRKNMIKINEFFNFSYSPFRKDISSLYESKDYSQLKARISFLLDNEGIGLFTGNNGVGKTVMINNLVSKEVYKVISLSGSSLSLFDLVTYIGQILEVDTSHCHKLRIIKDIENAISSYNLKGEKIILVINEAEELEYPILKLIRELIAVQGLYVILVAHTSFRSMCKDSKKSFLIPHILTNYNCLGLSNDETKQYIEYRLNLANYKDKLIDDKYYPLINDLTNGNPQTINKFMSNLLLIMAINNVKKASGTLIRKAKDEMDI